MITTYFYIVFLPGFSVARGTHALNQKGEPPSPKNRFEFLAQRVPATCLMRGTKTAGKL